MISEVPYKEILEIRKNVMYPNESVDKVILTDDNKGIHMGYYINNVPVSIFSIFLTDKELQFRKFATLQQYQKQGYGTKLMDWILDYARDMKFTRVWCNSRIQKTQFYKKFGFRETNKTFNKNGHEYVIMEIKFEEK